MMKILILGGAGFIGSNLALALAKDKTNQLILADEKPEYFCPLRELLDPGLTTFLSFSFEQTKDFRSLVQDCDLIFHLVSSSIPGDIRQQASEEFLRNVLPTISLLDACVEFGHPRLIFLSSGGAVYGSGVECPIREDAETNPISSYGVQKLTIEKLLQLYHHLHQLDYRIIRLSNPYGPFQRPDGRLGVITNFIDKMLKGDEIRIMGDGSVVRDFIYIDDAVNAILNIAADSSQYLLYNLGSGKGTSIKRILELIGSVLRVTPRAAFGEKRQTDAPVNYLDISRYIREFGYPCTTSLEEGIEQTAAYLRRHY